MHFPGTLVGPLEETCSLTPLTEIKFPVAPVSSGYVSRTQRDVRVAPTLGCCPPEPASSGFLGPVFCSWGRRQ